MFGRRLKVSALVDGDRTSTELQRIKRVAADNDAHPEAIVVCSDVNGMRTNADIEGLFAVEDYLQLYHWHSILRWHRPTWPALISPLSKLEDWRGSEFDHALPAHALTEHRREFFDQVAPVTVDNFTALFELLNATLAAS